ncbi:MAG: three-Cys-motif partner protein TcmP [Alphaproteobacteria bacterium]|nr:three-Cys-motif partner protein TcmP [Alphaproteobacteria bacterium]
MFCSEDGKVGKNEGFFKRQTEESETKSRIVDEYFSAWAKIVMPAAERRGTEIAYLDLFSGPGRYGDGGTSTPLLVLKAAIKDPRISKVTKFHFNDSNAEYVNDLERAIKSLPGIGKISRRPTFSNHEINERIDTFLNDRERLPTLSFVDPFGYKGFSMNLLGELIRDWGCDCIFFFNHDNVNRFIRASAVRPHMEAVFGKERLDNLLEEIRSLTGEARKSRILQTLTAAIREEHNVKYVLPFPFYNPSGRRSLHVLIFVSRHFKGYNVMKYIMRGVSSDDGRFGYSRTGKDTLWLFPYSQPLNKDDLLKTFSGRVLSKKAIYEEHSIGKLFVERDYTRALKDLEEEGKITARSTKGERKKGTFPEHVLIQFPKL